MEYQTISLFAAKGTIYYAIVATVISSYSVCVDNMFLHESSPGISLVFI